MDLVHGRQVYTELCTAFPAAYRALNAAGIHYIYKLGRPGTIYVASINYERALAAIAPVSKRRY